MNCQCKSKVQQLNKKKYAQHVLRISEAAPDQGGGCDISPAIIGHIKAHRQLTKGAWHVLEAAQQPQQQTTEKSDLWIVAQHMARREAAPDQRHGSGVHGSLHRRDLRRRELLRRQQAQQRDVKDRRLLGRRTCVGTARACKNHLTVSRVRTREVQWEGQSCSDG